MHVLTFQLKRQQEKKSNAGFTRVVVTFFVFTTDSCKVLLKILAKEQHLL